MSDIKGIYLLLLHYRPIRPPHTPLNLQWIRTLQNDIGTVTEFHQTTKLKNALSKA